jgi:AbrB family looped-hinge helix DNA binding protein
MKVTIKGQVTIPLAMRELYGLRPGTEVEFVPGPEALQVKVRRAPTGTRSELWLAKAAGSARFDTSTDEIMALTRGED